MRLVCINGYERIIVPDTFDGAIGKMVSSSGDSYLIFSESDARLERTTIL